MPQQRTRWLAVRPDPGVLTAATAIALRIRISNLVFDFRQRDGLLARWVVLPCPDPQNRGGQILGDASQLEMHRQTEARNALIAVDTVVEQVRSG